MGKRNTLTRRKFCMGVASLYSTIRGISLDTGDATGASERYRRIPVAAPNITIATQAVTAKTAASGRPPPVGAATVSATPNLRKLMEQCKGSGSVQSGFAFRM